MSYAAPMIRDMRDIVRDGYEAGDYPGFFRSDIEPSEHERYFLERLLSLLPSSPRILDLGCGTGVPFDRFLAAKSAKVIGVDFSAKHIALAKRNVPAASYVEGNFSRMDFDNNDFDAVVAFYAIFHLPRDEHEALFGKIILTLKSKSLFLATFGTVAHAYGEDANWTGAKMAWSSYDPDIYRQLLAESGFMILESRFEGKPGDQEHHWWVLAQKVD